MCSILQKLTLIIAAVNAILIPTPAPNQTITLKVCPGCCLKLKKDAFDFIYRDFQFYDRKIKIQYVNNAAPTLVINNDDGSVASTTNIGNFSRLQIRDLVGNLGIKPIGNLPVVALPPLPTMKRRILRGTRIKSH